MNLLRAWTTLFGMSLRRLFWSSNTLMVCLPVSATLLFMFRFRHWYAQKAMDNFPQAFERFSESFVIAQFASFLVPICALAYGTTSIGGDREDRTLLFLLIRPVPRVLILLAKVMAALPLAVGLVLASFYTCCWLAGSVGELAFRLYLPALLYMTVAYVCLFHCFAVGFRHSTIIALAYALFMEVFLGNMPGIVKRVAVNYYGRSILFEAGAAHGLPRPAESFFEPITAEYGQAALITIAVGALLLAMAVFQRREYRDLT